MLCPRENHHGIINPRLCAAAGRQPRRGAARGQAGPRSSGAGRHHRRRQGRRVLGAIERSGTRARRPSEKLRPVAEAALGSVRETLKEQGLPSSGNLTFVQARTAHEIAKAHLARLRLQERMKGELVDRAKRCGAGVPPGARGARCLDQLAGAGRGPDGGRARRRGASDAKGLGDACPRAASRTRRGAPRISMRPVGRSTQLRGRGRARPGLARRAATRSAAHGLRMGGRASLSEPARLRRARALSHRSHALHARDHGCAVADRIRHGASW